MRVGGQLEPGVAWGLLKGGNGPRSQALESRIGGGRGE